MEEGWKESAWEKVYTLVHKVQLVFFDKKRWLLLAHESEQIVVIAILQAKRAEEKPIEKFAAIEDV